MWGDGASFLINKIAGLPAIFAALHTYIIQVSQKRMETFFCTIEKLIRDLHIIMKTCASFPEKLFDINLHIVNIVLLQ